MLRYVQENSNGTPPPGIVRVYDLIRTGFLRRHKEHLLVMQYIEGRDLKREGRYSTGQMVHILIGVCDALAALHRLKLIHGDMKPENIMVDSAGKPTVVDFGFSCKVGSRAESIKGTREYIAPEQVDGGQLTEKTDVYNFGASMYFLFAGRHLPAFIPVPGDASHFIGLAQRGDAVAAHAQCVHPAGARRNRAAMRPQGRARPPLEHRGGSRGPDRSGQEVLRWLRNPKSRSRTRRSRKRAPIIAGFQLLKRVGSGGMGTVYRAKQLSVDRIVAVKILKPNLARDRKFLERFKEEAKAAAKLNHPNIVQAIDAGEAEGYFYFAMEFVDGETMHRLMLREGLIDEKKGVQIALDTAHALSHAHLHGIVHRDVKPGNIMISKEGLTKLCDLGLAQLREEEADNTGGRGPAVGTPYYISPEQAQGYKNVDCRSDIYSLGATLYRALAGRPAFDAPTRAEILEKHVHAPLPWPKDHNPALSDTICYIIAKMMMKKPEERYQTPDELAEDLERLKRGEPPKTATMDLGISPSKLTEKERAAVAMTAARIRRKREAIEQLKEVRAMIDHVAAEQAIAPHGRRPPAARQRQPRRDEARDLHEIRRHPAGRTPLLSGPAGIPPGRQARRQRLRVPGQARRARRAARNGLRARRRIHLRPAPGAAETGTAGLLHGHQPGDQPEVLRLHARHRRGRPELLGRARRARGRRRLSGGGHLLGRGVAPMPSGPASACPPRPSGRRPRAAPTAGRIRGETISTRCTATPANPASAT